MPMVSMTIENAGWPSTGRITMRSANMPNKRHRGDRRRHRQPEREAQHRHQHQAREGAEHHQVALREGHRLGGLVDEHEAQRDQAIDAALGGTTDDQLNELHGGDGGGRNRDARC